MRFIRNWKISLPVAGVVLAGLAWLAFGFFGVHTAFIDEEVSEAAPTFDLPAESANMPDDTVEVAETAETPEASVPQVDETADEATASADEASDVETDAAAPDVTDAVEPVATEAPAETQPAEPEIVTEASGQFTGTSSYDVSGDAIVLGNGTGQRFLRFENFESNNGPDLNVYLVNPDDPSDFIDLGDLKGNVGEQNYEIPADVDLDRYSQVSIWCVRFSVGFGTADLATA